MKTAISLPDRIFRAAERHARRTGKTRSQLYVEAVAEYLSRHSSESVTKTMNAALTRLEGKKDKFHTAAAKKMLGRESW